ncbi:hypothetical protein [Sinimarinibacterium flocculans]|uniref:hypothetical protein n=1 Tax=Sinimarinibacterium flocculans TaxID=985250 RepID=UPI003519001E
MNQRAEDDFLRGFHGVPSAEELRALSDVQLASLLSSCEAGSVKWLLINEEIHSRREAESLSISRKANIFARNANIWAAIATLIAAIAMYMAST